MSLEVTEPLLIGLDHTAGPTERAVDCQQLNGTLAGR